MTAKFISLCHADGVARREYASLVTSLYPPQKYCCDRLPQEDAEYVCCEVTTSAGADFPDTWWRRCRLPQAARADVVVHHQNIENDMYILVKSKVFLVFVHGP